MDDPAGADPAGWFTDPLGRYEYRWFNGLRWTSDVSVDGNRYVDPVPVETPALGPYKHSLPFGPGGAPDSFPYHFSGQPVAPRPSRTMAVLSFIAGMVGVVLGWMPFLFVIGAAGGITAIVLGIISVRRVSTGRAGGRGFAIAGLVLGIAALAMCVVGFILTSVAIREFVDFTEPGPVDVEISSCTNDARLATAAGTITNLDNETHDYLIVIDVVDRGERLDRVNIEVNDVTPDETQTWTRNIILDTGATDTGSRDTVRCELIDVTGPFPFGFSPVE